MVSFVSLFSGSDKNSSVFSYKNTNIMIDCGGSFKLLKEQLEKVNLSFSDIDAILITHSHSDHIKALPMIIKNTDIPIYASLGTHEEIFDMQYLMPKNSRIVIFESRPFSIKDIDISCFKTPHDTNFSLGYNFLFNKKSATFATDLGHISDNVINNVNGKDFVFLESNHDIDMLKNSGRPLNIIKRILGDNGHLSNELSASFSLSLAKKGLKRLMLGHLSGEANTPELAYSVTKNLFLKNGIKTEKDIYLDVAKRGILSNVVKF